MSGPSSTVVPPTETDGVELSLSLHNQQDCRSATEESSLATNIPIPTATKFVAPSSSRPDPPSFEQDILTPSPTHVSNPTSFDTHNLPQTSFQGSCTSTLITNPRLSIVTPSIVRDLGHFLYPEGVSSPKSGLGVNLEGKFIYDREFLLQFMSVCIEKPNIPLRIIEMGDHQPSNPAARTPRKSSTPSGSTTANVSTPIANARGQGEFKTSKHSTPATVLDSGSTSSTWRKKRTRSKRNKSNKVNDTDPSNRQATEDRVIKP